MRRGDDSDAHLGCVSEKRMKKYSMLQRSIAENHIFLDMLRLHKGQDKETVGVETIRAALGITRAKADANCDELVAANIVRRDGRRLSIDGDACYFLGVSVGSAHIRLVLLDLRFEPVSRQDIEERFGISNQALMDIDKLGYSEENDPYSYAYDTFSAHDRDKGDFDFDIVRGKTAALVNLFLDRAEDERLPAFPLLGIGFAVAGPVDYEGKTWYSSPRIPAAKNVRLKDIIGYRNFERAQKLGIFLSLDNNAKSSVISEYQHLQEQKFGRYTQDIALIYIGSGIGMAAVIGRKLLRGSRNFSGELGHVHLLLNDWKAGMEARSVEECVLKDAGEEAEEKDKDKGKGAYQRYIKFLPHVLNMVNCILGIDRFILLGHSVAMHGDLSSALMEDRFKFTVESTQQYCERESGGRNTPSTAAIGAAIEAYFCLCFYLEGEDRVNLAQDISWSEPAE